jgi:hypothetical protein
MRRWNLILRVFMSEYLHLHSEDAKTRSVLQRINSDLVGFHFLKYESISTFVSLLPSRVDAFNGLVMAFHYNTLLKQLRIYPTDREYTVDEMIRCIAGFCIA